MIFIMISVGSYNLMVLIHDVILYFQSWKIVADDSSSVTLGLAHLSGSWLFLHNIPD